MMACVELLRDTGVGTLPVTVVHVSRLMLDVSDLYLPLLRLLLTCLLPVWYTWSLILFPV